MYERSQYIGLGDMLFVESIALCLCWPISLDETEIRRVFRKCV